jgi:hypothetical protein
VVRRHSFLLVAIAALVVAVGLPASAPASSSACRSASKAHGAKIVAHDKVAVVFSVKKQTAFQGCAYGHAVRKLSAICCELEKVRLSGRFAAYTYSGTAIGDETSKVGVYDLRSGKRERLAKLEPNSEGGDPAEIETGSFVENFAVNSHGSPVWLIDQLDANGQPNGQFQLRAADGSAHTERIVDSGNIARKSLSISSDGKTIRYTKDGAAQTAPLAP